MAKKFLLTERYTNEHIYPVTVKDAVIGLNDAITEATKISDQENNILWLDTTGLSVNVGLKWTGSELQLVDHDNKVISTIDGSDFVKDGILDNVILDGDNLVFTFNTDSGKEPISVPLNKFIDTYTEGDGIEITDKAISVKYGETEGTAYAGDKGKELETVKADKDELFDYYAESVIDDNNYEDISKLTREDLKKDLFIDLFHEAARTGTIKECGKYDPENAPDEEHPFLLNGLWLSYEEALASYSKWCNSNLIRELYRGAKIRTNFPHPLRDIVKAESAFWASRIEVVNLSYLSDWIRMSGHSGVFRDCRQLREITTPRLENAGQSPLDFENCVNLEEVRLYSTSKKPLYLSACPKLSLASIQALVQNSPTGGFNVTVHANVYNKLTDTSNTEWNAVLNQAADKNITFSTP